MINFTWWVAFTIYFFSFVFLVGSTAYRFASCDDGRLIVFLQKLSVFLFFIVAPLFLIASCYFKNVGM